MMLHNLPSFFYERDLPNAKKVIATLEKCNFMLCGYSKYSRYGRCWEHKPLVFYRFAGLNYLLSPWGEDTMVSEDTMMALSLAKHGEPESIETARVYAKSYLKLLLNKRETSELAVSIRDGMRTNQSPTDHRLKLALARTVSKKYLLHEIREALKAE